MEDDVCTTLFRIAPAWVSLWAQGDNGDKVMRSGFFHQPETGACNPLNYEVLDITFFGRGGDDIVAGHNYADKLYRNEGNDTLRGELGSDVLFGGDGNDVLYGDKTPSLDFKELTLEDPWSWGDDRLFGGRGNDTLYGNLRDDRLRGDAGNDLVDGGRGNDTLRGGEGDDALIGGSGDDRLFGGKGSDTLTGGEGADYFAFRVGKGNDAITDFSEDDTLELKYSYDHPDRGSLHVDCGSVLLGNVATVVEDRGIILEFTDGSSLEVLGVFDLEFLWRRMDYRTPDDWHANVTA